MRITFKSYIRIPVLVFLVLFFCEALTAKDIVSNNYYREQVYLHLGRDTYIAGEKIWYKAYCQNQSNPELPALSNVIYIELLNSKNKHVLGHILKADKGSSESCFDIPDTLSSGLYFIKAYTQWMENFSPELFYSQPIFIYNYYNENSENQYSSFNIPDEPKVFIEGNKLVGGISSKVAVSFTEFKGKELPLKVIDTESGETVAEFSLNRDGEGTFDLRPTFGHQYLCSLTDSNSKFGFKLPESSNDGYKIDINSVTENNIVIHIERNNVIDQKLEVSLLSNDNLLDHKTVSSSMMNNDLILSFSGAKSSMVEVLLKDTYGKILTTNAIWIKTSSTIQLQSLRKEYSTGEKIDMNLLFNSPNSLNELNASVSIHKSTPALNRHNNDLVHSFHTMPFRLSNLNNQYSLVLSAYNNEQISDTKKANYKISNESILPVEDMGIICKGVVIDTKTNHPAPNLNIIYSIKDSIPNLQSVITNSAGQFAILISHSGELQTFIGIYKDQKPVSDQYQIIFDNKFNYQDQSDQYTFRFQPADSIFRVEIQDEAQRAFIQKVFVQRESETAETQTINNSYKSDYFSNSLLTVTTDDYFSMPNFEEIAREILPRVQYRYSKDGCTMAIITSNPEFKSYNPLVLLNGIPVEDNCELYGLNSEMITKVYIQHEPRIVGNLYYDGLILILTSPDKKLKNLKANTKNLAKLPSYTICPEYDPLKIQKQNLPNNKLPDFRNQLYWNSINLQNGETQSIQFITSDEEGDFVVDICGFQSDGTPVNYQDTFTIKSKQ
jgi:hypothetical protein